MVGNDSSSLDSASENRARRCHGRPLRELKLELWWTKMCEVSSYATYETSGICFLYNSGDGRWRAGDGEKIQVTLVDGGGGFLWSSG
jgi:hypothetical protein